VVSVTFPKCSRCHTNVVSIVSFVHVVRCDWRKLIHLPIFSRSRTKQETYTKRHWTHIQRTLTWQHHENVQTWIRGIDSELKEISSRLGIGDRIERMKKREAFITLLENTCMQKPSRCWQNHCIFRTWSI
jgi:hypothetical protein